VAIVVDDQFLAYSLRVNYKTFGAKGSESDNLANNSVARNLDGREMPFGPERPCDARGRDKCARSDCTLKKTAPMHFAHRR